MAIDLAAICTGRQCLPASADPAGIWDRFCQRFRIAQTCVPLFAADDAGVVAHRVIGQGASARHVLVRSPAMEEMVLAETAELVADWQAKEHRYDGLLYCMGWKIDDGLMPLYIGKAETLGKGNGNLSANISRLQRDRSKFARWGDNYSYHIGDLSACVLPGHDAGRRTVKYSSWAATLFSNAPSESPTLRQPVFFWATAWESSQIGVWEELGPVRLAFLEYLLIGVAGLVCPHLLNREGISRSARQTAVAVEHVLVQPED